MPHRLWPPTPTSPPATIGPGGAATPGDAIALRLEAIRLRFLARLREDYELVSRHRDAGDLSAPDVAMIVHRMAGSAGLVGYPQISEAAGRLDNALADRSPDPQPLFDALLVVLRAVLLDAAGEQPS